MGQAWGVKGLGSGMLPILGTYRKSLGCCGPPCSRAWSIPQGSPFSAGFAESGATAVLSVAFNYVPATHKPAIAGLRVKAAALMTREPYVEQT